MKCVVFITFCPWRFRLLLFLQTFSMSPIVFSIFFHTLVSYLLPYRNVSQNETSVEFCQSCCSWWLDHCGRDYLYSYSPKSWQPGRDFLDIHLYTYQSVSCLSHLLTRASKHRNATVLFQYTATRDRLSVCTPPRGRNLSSQTKRRARETYFKFQVISKINVKITRPARFPSSIVFTLCLHEYSACLTQTPFKQKIQIVTSTALQFFLPEIVEKSVNHGTIYYLQTRTHRPQHC